MPESNTVVAMDVGGTNLRYALVRESSGEIDVIRREAIPTGDPEDREVLINRIFNATRTAIEWGAELPIGIGFSLAGSTDPVSGVMYRPPNLMAFHEFSPAAAVESEVGLKTISANDATAAALAEYRYGSHGKLNHLVYLTLSTGVGGGQVVGGELYTGAGGFAGEWGHMTLDPEGPPCNCGNRGCLESYCSGPAVVRIARAALATNLQNSILRVHSYETLTAETVHAAAREGDALALSVWRESGRYLGIALAGLLNAVDPDVIVIGGSVSKALDLMMPAAESELSWRVMEQHRGRLPVVNANMGDDSALLGAAAMAFQAFG
jgi:glucokinase